MATVTFPPNRQLHSCPVVSGGNSFSQFRRRVREQRLQENSGLRLVLSLWGQSCAASVKPGLPEDGAVSPHADWSFLEILCLHAAWELLMWIVSLLWSTWFPKAELVLLSRLRSLLTRLRLCLRSQPPKGNRGFLVGVTTILCIFCVLALK